MPSAASRFRAAAASAALAAALAAVSFGARGGTELGRTAVVELLLVAAGAGAVCLALIRTAAGLVRTGGAEAAAPAGTPLHGGPAVAAFAALAALTALSIGWSIAPDVSYAEAGRTLAYLAAFAGAVAAARLAPTAAPVVVRAVLLAAVAVAAYGLAARVWPGSFSESGLTGRISLPFDYWNALAGVAAIGLPAALWLGTRRSGSAAGRALAYPAAGVLVAALLIAQSRGALLGAAVACALWLALVPLRLRSLAVLAVAAAGAGSVAAWALSKDPFRAGAQPLPAREAVAGDFGLLLLAMLVATLAAGLLVETIRARRPATVRTRVRAGAAAATVALLVPLALLTSVALSDRGLAGTLSDRADDLTSETSAPPAGGARLGSVSSARGGYWREAWDAFEERPAIGLGAGAFELARLAHRDDASPASRAHGFVPQTLADLGLAGGTAVLLLLAAWLVATARSTAIGPRRRVAPSAWSSERAAVVALALAAVAYGVQSALDWTWFVPGVTVMALVAAGYVAGRGPRPRLGAASPASGPAPPGGSTGPEPADAEPRADGDARGRARLLAATAVAATALAAVWAIWQPVAADRAVTHSYELLGEGRAGDALDEAERARRRNPYSQEALYAQAAALAALGREAAALRTLTDAVRDRPRDPNAWVRAATFELHTLGAPRRALELTDAALRVDPHSRAAALVRDTALAELATRAGGP
jgi:O-Antigen ligase